MRDNRLPLGQILVLLGAIGILLILMSHALFVPPPMPSLAVVVKPKGYGYVGNLYRVNADGSQLQQLAADVSPWSAPVWSPNGEQILFATQTDLWIIDADGTHRRQLTHDANLTSEPVWSPDGRSIVLIADNNVAVIDATGATLRQITNQATGAGQDAYGYHHPSWSPNGKYIAFEGYYRPTANNDIFVVDAACADPNCVGHFQINSRLDEVYYNWSPDSKFIVFGSVRSKTRFVKLYMIDLTDETTRQVTTDLLNDSDPQWSPDGSKIAFTSFTNDQSKLFVSVIDIDGHEELRLPIDTANWVRSLEWSPDGHRLAYSVDQELYLRAEDGTTDSIHFDNAEFLMFDWRP